MQFSSKKLPDLINNSPFYMCFQGAIEFILDQNYVVDLIIWFPGNFQDKRKMFYDINFILIDIEKFYSNPLTHLLSLMFN